MFGLSVMRQFHTHTHTYTIDTYTLDTSQFSYHECYVDCVKARRMSTANQTGICMCFWKEKREERSEWTSSPEQINLYVTVYVMFGAPFCIVKSGSKTSYNCNMLRIDAHPSNQHTDAACVWCWCGISETNDITYSFDKRLFSFALNLRQ